MDTHTHLVCWAPYCQKSTFERYSMFQSSEYHVLKGTTIKGMNRENILFFKSRPYDDNNFKGYQIVKPQKFNYGKCSKISNTKK